VRNIPLKAIPFGDYCISGESNISELNSGFDGLRIIVEFWNRNDPETRQKIVEIFFEGYSRHRELEEVDLAPYWERREFSDGNLIYEITSGGWLSYDAVGEKLLSWVTACDLREWFVCTNNYSATVLCKKQPTIKVLKEL